MTFFCKFADLGVSIIYIHPGTSVSAIEPLLDFADYVMVMCVNPGFAGQEYIPTVEKKIAELVNLRSNYHYKIVLNGTCSPERIKKYSKMGVDGFVLGTSALFNKDSSYEEIIKTLRNL